MQLIPKSVQRLIEEFGRLPGIGPRTAERLTFFLLRSQPAVSQNLGQALLELHESIRFCQICHNLTEHLECDICTSSERDKTIIAIVEEPLDVVALEKTGQYSGLYHVLGGVISPLDGIGPDQLTITQLFERLSGSSVKEIILATNPITEGEATAMYIRKQLENSPIKVTRLARGLPVGGDLEYADQITLGRALQGRQDF
jgi:recombination protein RecR